MVGKRIQVGSFEKVTKRIKYPILPPFSTILKTNPASASIIFSCGFRTVKNRTFGIIGKENKSKPIQENDISSLPIFAL